MPEWDQSGWYNRSQRGARRAAVSAALASIASAEVSRDACPIDVCRRASRRFQEESGDLAASIFYSAYSRIIAEHEFARIDRDVPAGGSDPALRTDYLEAEAEYAAVAAVVARGDAGSPETHAASGTLIDPVEPSPIG